jgi:hypothetical protein
MAEVVENFQCFDKEFADLDRVAKGNPRLLALFAYMAVHRDLLVAREARIELERRVEALEMDHVRTLADCYRGVWRAAESYRRGDLVSHGGSTWLALRDTEAQPGDGAGTGWRLIVKKGRDANTRKDGEK